MSKSDRMKLKLHSLKKNNGNSKDIELLRKKIKENKKEVQLEILVEELRKTVCILGKMIQVQNASIRDENLENFLEYKLKELKELRSLGKVKEYLGIN